MRYLPTLFRSSRSYADLPIGDITGPDRGEAGADADPWLADLMGGGPDVNPELTGSAKFPVYDEMADTDPTVKGLIMVPSLTARSGNWGLNAAEYGQPSDDPVAVAIADYCAWNVGLEGHLGELDISWDKQLHQVIGSTLRWGAMFEELVWGDVVTWRDRDGDEHLVRPLRRLAPRAPGTVQRVERNRDGSIKAVVQNLPNTTPIPGDKLTYTVFEPKPGSWDGHAMIRPAWFSWRLKKAIMVSAGIGYDRFFVPTPIVFHPDTPEGETKGRSIGEHLRSGERAYVRFPIPQGGTKEDAEWALDAFNLAEQLGDPAPMIRICTEQISAAGLQEFLRLGQTGSGSRALGDTQVQPFYQAVQAISGDVARERTRQVLRRVVEVNFGLEAAARYTPTLTVSKIQIRDIETISKAMALLGDAGFRFTDVDAEDDIRELLGMPALNRDELGDRGIDYDTLVGVLRGLGLDEQTFADIVAALPPEFGVARNRVEGDPLFPASA